MTSCGGSLFYSACWIYILLMYHLLKCKSVIERHLPQRNLPKDNCPKNLLLNLFCSTDNCPIVFCPKNDSLREKSFNLMVSLFYFICKEGLGYLCYPRYLCYLSFLEPDFIWLFRCWVLLQVVKIKPGCYLLCYIRQIVSQLFYSIFQKTRNNSRKKLHRP